MKCWAYQFLTEVPADPTVTAQCTLFTEWDEDLKGDASPAASCYTQEKTTNEKKWLTDKRTQVGVEKATEIQHYMVAFSSKISHLQTTLNSLDEATLAKALTCIGALEQPAELTDPTYEEHVANLEKTVNGFYKCLIDQQVTTVPKDGFCGPGSSEET